MPNHSTLSSSFRNSAPQILAKTFSENSSAATLGISDGIGYEKGKRGDIMKLCQIFAYNFWPVIPVKGVEVGDE
jgi:hypothetical protein